MSIAKWQMELNVLLAMMDTLFKIIPALNLQTSHPQILFALSGKERSAKNAQAELF